MDLRRRKSPTNAQIILNIFFLVFSIRLAMLRYQLWVSVVVIPAPRCYQDTSSRYEQEERYCSKCRINVVAHTISSTLSKACLYPRGLILPLSCNISSGLACKMTRRLHLANVRGIKASEFTTNWKCPRSDDEVMIMTRARGKAQLLQRCMHQKDPICPISIHQRL